MMPAAFRERLIEERSFPDALLLSLYLATFLVATLAQPFLTAVMKVDGVERPVVTARGEEVYRYCWYAINALGAGILLRYGRDVLRTVLHSRILQGLALFLLLQLPSSLFGAVPQFGIYLPLACLHIALLVWLLPPVVGGRPVLIPILSLFLAASLVLAALRPEGTMEMAYPGLLPFRYFGVLYHANVMATASLILVVYELIAWEGPALGALLNLGLGGISLVASQGKTQWIFFLFFVLLWGGGRLARRVNLRGTKALLAAGLCLLWAGLVLGTFFDPEDFWRLATGLTGSSEEGLRTMTGRDQIYTVSFLVWLRHPLYGYGPGFLGEAFQRSTGVHFAHAHNQFLQCLASAGLVGMAGLLVLLGVWAREGWKRRWEDRGQTLALLFLFLAWCLGDVPMQGQPMYILLLGLVLAFADRPRETEE